MRAVPTGSRHGVVDVVGSGSSHAPGTRAPDWAISPARSCGATARGAQGDRVAPGTARGTNTARPGHAVAPAAIPAIVTTSLTLAAPPPPLYFPGGQTVVGGRAAARRSSRHEATTASRRQLGARLPPKAVYPKRST